MSCVYMGVQYTTWRALGVQDHGRAYPMVIQFSKGDGIYTKQSGDVRTSAPRTTVDRVSTTLHFPVIVVHVFVRVCFEYEYNSDLQYLLDYY